MGWTSDKAEPFEAVAGNWWRFDRYEIRDGYIRPAPGSKLEEYDPWDAYRASWDKEAWASSRDLIDIPWEKIRKESPPYVSLLNLLSRVIQENPDGWTYKIIDADGLLEWCSKNGVLGIALQITQEITLAPRWELNCNTNGVMIITPAWPPFYYDKDDGLFSPMQRHYRRVGNKWTCNRAVLSSKHAKLYNSQSELQHQLVTNDYELANCQAPNALIQKVGDFSWEAQPLSKMWAWFFPDVPPDERETYLYPLPLTEDFWTQYGEHVQSFFNGAFQLRSALECFQGNDVSISHGILKLNSLITSTTLRMEKSDDGKLRQRWSAPSLLGSFATMALQDLTQKKAILSCPVCNQFFGTKAYQGQYCSVRCRDTAQKRRYRMRASERSKD